ncbi:hypothetical protein WA026_009053 [Henosepilachna vigintioctopunctata]|uniref:Uncharacterized protein n=1 Tax=Henosepilachna vigintioctopunctata TaxID=420089 RepID=A0AAW1UVI0_9CUCU
MSKEQELVIEPISDGVIPRRSTRLAAKKAEHLNQSCSEKENLVTKNLKTRSREFRSIVPSDQEKQIGSFGRTRNNIQKVSTDQQKINNKPLIKVTIKSKGNFLNNSNRLSPTLVKMRNKKSFPKIDSLHSTSDTAINISKGQKIKNDNTQSEVSSRIFLNSAQNNAKVKRKHNLHKNDSFEEYGLLLPSYEKILGNKVIMENEARALDTYEELYADLDITLPNELKDMLNLNDTPGTSDLLDCKSLSIEELSNCFYENLNYIRNILEGNVYSERHKKFIDGDPTFDFTYSISTVIYTEEQQDHLLMLLEKNFDPEAENTQYFFKVLLPELCLKIFMDLHNKTFEEAVKYLEWMPVE